MRVLLAFDKFKDALSAEEACVAAAETLRTLHPDWQLDLCPLADGGDGFAEILTRAAGGELRTTEVSGPRDARITAAFGLVPLFRLPAAIHRRLPQLESLPRDALVGLVSLATASGLALLAPDERDPWQTSTFGTGELIRAAAAAGARVVLLGLGGSATHDLGLGALAALGLECRTDAGELVPRPVPARWADIARFTGAVDRSLPPLVLACDVTNPLLGPRGSVAVFGPQKGLRAADQSRLERASARLALMLCAHAGASDTLLDTPGSGAAGGTAFGLIAGAGAQLVRGFDLVADWLDLDARIAAADLVLTGEGRYDASSLEGKGPGAVVARAAAQQRPAHVFAGAIDAIGNGPATLHAITPPALPLAEALPRTAGLLRNAIRQRFPAAPLP